MFLFLLLNDFGLIKLIKLKNKHTELQNTLNTLLVNQSTLRIEIEQLQTDQDYINKIAREKFMMVKPGEKVYRVKDQKKIDLK